MDFVMVTCAYEGHAVCIIYSQRTWKHESIVAHYWSLVSNAGHSLCKGSQIGFCLCCRWLSGMTNIATGRNCTVGFAWIILVSTGDVLWYEVNLLIQFCVVLFTGKRQYRRVAAWISTSY